MSYASRLIQKDVLVTVQPESLILVSVINNPRDLEIARLLGWYRIPLRSAPKVISVDFLAFYQTGAFSDEKWRIQYTAAVKGNELVTRAQLLLDEPDHPHAQHEYYKIQLGSLERLSKPIPAVNWRRITFFYTFGEYLLSANTIDDLIVSSDQRQFLWQALRERQQHESRYKADPQEDADLSPEILAALLGLNFYDAPG